MVPARITIPIGIQSELWLIIIGITPTAVVAEVRKMGIIRRLPASKAASLTCTLLFRRFSAWSNMMMAFRTMIPIRLMRPRMHVSPNSSPLIQTPTDAPTRQNDSDISAARARLIFLKLIRRKKKMMMMAIISPWMMGLMASLSDSSEPPYSTPMLLGIVGSMRSSTIALTFLNAATWL